jgi:uncharacterized lipoprotein
MKVKITGIILALLMVILAGCSSPDSDIQRNKYNNYQKSLKQDLASKYPAFRTYLVTVSQAAHKIAVEADKLTDEGERLKRFREANKIFSASKLYTELSSLHQRMETMITKKNRLAGTVNNQYQEQIRAAVNRATNALNRAVSMMEQAKPANLEAALEEIKKAGSLLTPVETRLDSVIELLMKGTKKTSTFQPKKEK